VTDFVVSEIQAVGHLGKASVVAADSWPALVSALMLVLSLTTIARLSVGKPWTTGLTVFLAGIRGRPSPDWIRGLNRFIAGFWAIVLLWLAAAVAVGSHALAIWLPLLAAVASLFVPRWRLFRAMSVRAAGDPRNNWPAPKFNGRSRSGTSPEPQCDVAIIGAGIGGLTTAAFLAQSGLKVIVCEHHNVAGGFAHNWRRRATDPRTGERLEFRFDSGVHDISGWHPGGTVRNVFERFGIADDFAWERVDHRYVIDGRPMDIPRDWRAYARKLGEMFPDDAAGITSFFEETFILYGAMYSTAADNGGIPGRPKTARALLRYANDHPLALAWLRRPWGEFMSRHVESEEAIKWLSVLGGYITTDLGKTSVVDMVPLFGYYFNGGYYPVGGSGRPAESLVTVIERYGGEVRLSTDVVRITKNDGAATGIVVRTKRGQESHLSARAVVCNADPGVALDDLLEEPTIRRTLESQAGPLEPSCSAVGVYLAIRGTLQTPPFVLLDGPEGAAGMVVTSILDPSCAPKGYTTVEALDLLEHEEASSWFPSQSNDSIPDLDGYRRSPQYLDRKKAAGDALISRIKRLVPDIEERIIFRADSSPITYKRYCRTSDGAVYGTTGARDAPPTKSPLRNLVIAGSATDGAGVEAVIVSASKAAEALRPGILS